MYIIAGLGNPGREYVGTRHNIGFEIIDVLCSKYNIKLNKNKYKAVYGEGKIGGEKVVIAKPQTYMNLSGESIRELKEWYKTENKEIVIIYDDISLPVGKIRIRPKGSAGGHNGIKNIIYQLQTDVFPRVKVGIDSPKHPDFELVDYVLSKFSKEEVEKLIPIAIKATEAIEDIIVNGTDSAMSKFN